MKKLFAVEPYKIRFFSYHIIGKLLAKKHQIKNKNHKKTGLMNNPVFLLNIKFVF